ncbi:MAG TPA: hypothetical protein VK574_05600 [Terracidiphilus sp.]|nr:hypothetical protein [Terracidiphilus sp.]
MTKSRDQGTGIRDQEADRMTLLLKSAIPRMDDDADLPRDLWPAMLRRMDEETSRGAASVPWFDWALAGGLVAFAAIVPRTIPVILYYL